MKILQLTQTAGRGGADISAYRLCRALNAAGEDCRMLTAEGDPEDPMVARIPKLSLPGRACFHLMNLLGMHYTGIPNPGRILDHPFFEAADVVHLHTLHGGYFNYLWLPRLTARKPAVWTLHDMWALTGHCSHSFSCERWRSGCGRCPYPGIYPPIRMDSTRWAWRLKKRVYARSRLEVVVPSRWLADRVRASILSDVPVHVVSNGVDTERYRPRDRSASRRELGIPPDGLVVLAVLAGRDNPFKDRRLLVSVLRSLPESFRGRLRLLTMGIDPLTPHEVNGWPVTHRGYLRDEEEKARVYAAADLFVYPSRAENQPLAILEAMAAGCPVVASRVGGIPELVTDGETGFLAPVGDVEAFRAGMVRLLNDPALRDRVSRAAREFVAQHHAHREHVRRMQEIYRKVAGS